MEDQQQSKPLTPCPTCGNVGLVTWNRRASPSSSVLERAREALQFGVVCIELSEQFRIGNPAYEQASARARSALAEIDRALGGGK